MDSKIRDLLGECGLRWLISKGADVGAINSVGASPLHLAANRLHKQSISSLLQSGAEILATDLDGKTPLHYLVECMVNRWDSVKYCEKEWISIIRCMTEYGADANFCDSDGKTPWSHIGQSEDALNSEIYWLLVTSRQVVWLFFKQPRLQFVPFLHSFQGRLAAQG